MGWVSFLCELPPTETGNDPTQLPGEQEWVWGIWAEPWFGLTVKWRRVLEWGWFPKQGCGHLRPEQDAPGHREGREGSRAPPAPQTSQHSQFHMTRRNNPLNPALTQK